MGLLQRLVTLIGRGFLRRPTSPANINFRKLEQCLGYTIHNRSLFVEALSHRSYLQVVTPEITISPVSNERLEFLGDAVLGLVVAEHLFTSHLRAPEGDLTKYRSRLVNRRALSAYAEHLRLTDFILMSPNASQITGRGLETIRSDAFEAIVGAIYLDGGYRAAQRFVEHCIHQALQRGSVRIEDENFKSLLLEFAQGKGLGTPRYTTVEESGPDHDRTFTVEVLLSKKSYGVGQGKNKKDAEQAAAEKALRHLRLL
jgi:ribonuclease-3